MYPEAIQAQIDEHARRAKIDRRAIPPLFLVFESGPYARAGRVLASTGDVVSIGGRRCICLIVPIGDVVGIVHPDSLTPDGRHVRIAQSADGCAPVNGPAAEMSAALT
jgi:hypothetical protein